MNANGTAACQSPVAVNLPTRIARRLRKSFIDWRWKRLGYDSLCPEPGVSLRVFSDTRLGELLRWGAFEQNELCFLARFLRPGDTVVDIGANIGLYSLLSGSYVGPSGRVFSFEPCQKTFRRLSGNVARNRMRHVQCHQLAISSQNGHATLNVSLSGFEAWNSLAGQLASGDYRQEQITTRTWDAFAAEQTLVGAVTFMKIDVEGWEGEVLKGAAETLGRDDAPVLQVEFTAENASSAGASMQQLFDQLIDLGFEMYRFDSHTGELSPASPPTSGHYNLFAIKNLEFVIKRLTGNAVAQRQLSYMHA